MWFYITGQRIQEGSQELVGGDLYQCPTRSISSGDFEELRSWIRRVCEEIGWVQARNPSSIEYLVSRPGGKEGKYKVIAYLPSLDGFEFHNSVRYPSPYDFRLEYYARVYHDGRYLRITIPKVILPDEIMGNKKLIISLYIEVGKKLTFSTRLQVGRSGGKTLYYFIRIPKRVIRGHGIQEDELIGRKVKVIITDEEKY